LIDSSFSVPENMT